MSSNDVLVANVWQTHVVPVTSNVARADIVGNVLLPTAASGLPKRPTSAAVAEMKLMPVEIAYTSS